MTLVPDALVGFVSRAMAMAIRTYYPYLIL
jgi:hypothetical protein